MKDVVAILKLMESPKTNLPICLEAICEADRPDPYGSSVQVGCSLHLHPHSISLQCFQYLEEAEGVFGTTEFTVESVIHLPYLPNNSLLALVARLSRQQQRLTSVNIGGIWISSKKEAEDFKTLMQAVPPDNLATQTGVNSETDWSGGV